MYIPWSSPSTYVSATAVVLPWYLVATLGCLPQIAGHAYKDDRHNVKAPLTLMYPTPLVQPMHTDSADRIYCSCRACLESPLIGGCACRNIGHDVNAPLTRVYATPLAQPMHTDSADMVALLSLRLAREGGLSSWASSTSVHNELLRLGRKVLFFPLHTFHTAPLGVAEASMSCAHSLGLVPRLR